MSNCFITRRMGSSGGADAELNYKIYKVSAQPSSTGTENDIAIVTDVVIGDVQINNVVEPTVRSDGSALQTGDVYIVALITTAVAFNAIRENALFGLPGTCYQYDGASWMSMDAFIYRSGAWVMFSNSYPENYILWNGVLNEVYGFSNTYQSTSNRYSYTEGVGISCSSETGVFAAYTVSQFDVTSFTTLHVKLSGRTGTVMCGITLDRTKYGSTNYAAFVSNMTVGDNTVDVSTKTGGYFVGFGINQTSAYGFTCTDIWFT